MSVGKRQAVEDVGVKDAPLPSLYPPEPKPPAEVKLTRLGLSVPLLCAPNEQDALRGRYGSLYGTMLFRHDGT